VVDFKVPADSCWLLFIPTVVKAFELSQHAKLQKMRERIMKAKEEYDFSNATQGAVVETPANKTRITIRLDNDLIDWFRSKVHEAGGGNYQTLINDALRQYVQQHEGTLERTLRKVIREELQTMAR
jgi:uncharacterized protein (DUF4415 family)